MGRGLKKITDMVKQYPEGISLKTMAEVYKVTYHKKLALAGFGFQSITGLVESLHMDLVIEGQRVFHRTHIAAGAKAAHNLTQEQLLQSGGKKSSTSQTMEEGLKQIIDMVRQHPTGIPMKKMSQVYNQTYKENLTVASLGFMSISSLVESLHEELVVEGQHVFHRTHRPPATAAQPRQSLTQEQLFQRVTQVLKYHPNASMEQLRSSYRQLYGEALPEGRYICMVDAEKSTAGPQQAEEPPVQKASGGQGLHLTNQHTIPADSAVSLTAAPKHPGKDVGKEPEASPGSPPSEAPELGVQASLNRDVRRRLGNAAQIEGPSPVFKEAYHSQLREVHRDNMRAAEVLTQDGDNTNARCRYRSVDLHTVNSLAEDVIRDLAAQGELVTKDKVISRVCELLQVPSVEAVGIKKWQIAAIKELDRTLTEIHLFIESTEAVASILTLYELGQSLAGLKDKKHYEELNLGPLCKLPLVHRLFRISSSTKDDDIPNIGAVDILRCLRIFRRKCNKPKVDLAEFMQYLANHYHCETPWELGIRIHSVGLPIATLRKVNNCEHAILDAAQETIKREIEDEVMERMRKIKRAVLEPAQGHVHFSSLGSMELRKKYVSMTAAEALLAVYSHSAEVFSPKMTKWVQDFLHQVSCDRLALSLFQLAICAGSLAAPQDLVPKDKPSKQKGPKTDPEPATAPPPSEAAVKQYLKDSLSSQNSVVTLVQIASLEKKLTKHFQVKEFLSLEQGTFLEFLVKHIQLLQETVGVAVSLSNREPFGCGFQPSRQDVFELIKQCGTFTSTEPDALHHIECALRDHYGVPDSRDLGLGPLRTLADLVQRQRTMVGGGGPSLVFYEAALFAKHSSTTSVCESVGLLGELTRDQALASLLSCPLLEDLSMWSQWEVIFKPLYKSLKDFVERNGSGTDLAVLEVSPGVLLRITTHTGDKLFCQAATSLDPVGTAGHLVSMVVADGFGNAPTALLANHMQSALAGAVAKDDMTQEDDASYSTVARFLLDCLIRIPTRTCESLLKQVFLEPFSCVVGQAKSKAVLLREAQRDTRHLNCLHHLGLLLGITEWRRDYNSKLSPRRAQGITVPLGQHKTDLVDSASSSLSALNISESPEDTLDSCDSPVGLHSTQHTASEEDEEDQDDDDESDEELYELTSEHNQAENGTVETQSQSDENLQEGDEESSNPSGEDDTDDQLGCTVSPQRAVVDDIRKTEFGIGVELNTEGQKLMKVHQERLGRSLDRLSTELYSKDAHFVLELIQNADDNSYLPEGGVVPALAFVVERDCVTVLNNETGFQEKNVRAICDVGRSTKGKHKYGYIGQKGIGFKSVFKVTDCPEIHSNGFHLRFDKTCGPMGYILPHWTEDERPLDTHASSSLAQYSWSTKICLPLRPESQKTRNLFHDVHPSLLLFLHRLRSITIYSQTEKRLVSMSRRDVSDSVLEVQHTDGMERWLVVKGQLHPGKVRVDVEATELALAFQLDDSSLAEQAPGQPQKQPVFAFLPLRSFGFRFIIQGDFDIPSSREDLDRDSPWNQWLRSEIPQLFLQAMEVFSAHPEFSGLNGLCHFLQFVPLPDEVLDFFKPVAMRVIQLLKGKAFLPTRSSDGGVVYKLPSQVAVCQDAVIRNVIGREELERHLSLAYLHPGLCPAPPISLLTHLGVRHLSGSDVTSVTTAMAKELMQDGGVSCEDGLRQLARLLVCNFRALEYGYGEADSILQTLRDLPIIPLADGRVVALSKERVFFPMEKPSNTKKGQPHIAGPLAALYQDVSTVHPSLLASGEPLEAQQVRELLRRLGVHHMEPQQLLEQHIYPALHSSLWKSKPQEVVVSYLVFIKQHSCSAQEYTHTAIPILTNRGLRCPAQDRVHFSVEYGNMDLSKKLPGCDWLTVSPCYVKSDGDVAGWRELLVTLGVRDRLIIHRERRTFTAAELVSSPWSLESSHWPRGLGEGGYVLDDYPSEEFHSLATAQLPGPLLLEQRRALLEMLETNWDTGDCYSQYLTASVLDADGRPVKSTKSSFLYFLSQLSWVPAYRQLEGGARQMEFLRPSAVYLMSPAVSGLLGTQVAYVDLGPGQMSSALGMRHSVSSDQLISYLKEWCVATETRGEAPVGSKFSSTATHIHNVYCHLLENCSTPALKELFERNPAVFIAYHRCEDDWCSGRFYHLREVCWSEPTGMFQRYKTLTCAEDSTVHEPRLLAPFYSQLDGMRELFRNTLHVESSPNMHQYVGLLELICQSCPMPTAEVLQDVSVIYATLAHKCKRHMSSDQDDFPIDHNYCATLKGMVSDKRVFPTKDNTWVTLARKPMIADRKDLEKVFKAHREVCLLNLPPAAKKTPPKSKNQQGNRGVSVPAFSEQDRSLFLEICGVSALSQHVRTEDVTESLRPCPAIQALVRAVAPYIQRFLYHHEELATVYKELVQDGIADTVRRLVYRQVGKLYIRYLLEVADSESPVVELQDVPCLLKDNKELYIQKDHLTAKHDICRELVKLFCTETGHRKELVHFLGGLMASLDDPRALSRFLVKEDIRELPDEEERWEVPEPSIPVPSREPVPVSAPEERPPPGIEDGEQSLMCWPPRAPLQNLGSGGAASRADGSAVEAVMKMWPPPPEPKDRDQHKYDSHGGLPQSQRDGQQGPLPPRSADRPADQPCHRGPPGANNSASNSANTSHIPSSSEGDQQGSHSVGHIPSSSRGETREEGSQAVQRGEHPPVPEHSSTYVEQPAPSHIGVPEAMVVSTVFQGTDSVADAQRPPLAMDNLLWNRGQPPKVILEDLDLQCQRPTTVVFSDKPSDLDVIGLWGEKLVHSYLCAWRDSEEAGRPSLVAWCNLNGESGQPYDFKLVFGAASSSEQEGNGASVLFVEVKSTVKRDKAFIHFSANELDFALKEKARYHVYRVYSAGDANSVRLCRIKNLAQHLHTKDLEMFVFV